MKDANKKYKKIKINYFNLLFGILNISCIFEYQNEIIMKTLKINSFEGETYSELNGQLNYVNSCLSQDMEVWERKEYELVKKDLDFKLSYF